MAKFDEDFVCLPNLLFYHGRVQQLSADMLLSPRLSAKMSALAIAGGSL
jgi:hypothetical protein